MRLTKKTTKDCKERIEPSDQLKELTKSYNLDWQSIDIASCLQTRKDYSSDKTWLEQYFRPFLIEQGGIPPKDDAYLKEGVERLKNEQEKAFLEEIQLIKEEERRALEQNYKGEGELLESPSMEQLHHRILMVARGFWVGAIIRGQGGMGKTHSSKILLNKEIPNKWTYLTCKLTPLANYITLYENRDKEVILFEDLEGMDDITEFMKAATDDMSKERVIQYNSSKLPKNVPSAFQLRARIIWLSNKEVKDDALKRRFYYYDHNPSYQEKIHLIKQLAKKKGIPELARWIENNTDESTINLNLRTLDKVQKCREYSPEKWESIVLKEPDLQRNEETHLILEMTRQQLPVKEQIVRYKEDTGKCRASFYNARDRIYG